MKEPEEIKFKVREDEIITEDNFCNITQPTTALEGSERRENPCPPPNAQKLIVIPETEKFNSYFCFDTMMEGVTGKGLGIAAAARTPLK